jgi:hypothetical protein
MRKTDKNMATPSDKLDKAPSSSKDRGSKEAKSPPLTFAPQLSEKEQSNEVLEHGIFRMPSPPPIG